MSKKQPRIRLVSDVSAHQVRPNRPPSFDDRLTQAPTTDDAITILNERHFTIQAGSKMVVGVQKEDKDEVVTLLSYPQFKNRYLWHKRDGQDLGSLWLKSPLARHLDGRVVFAPPGTSVPARPQDYNTWRDGFAVKPRKGSWRRLYEHIRNIICHDTQDWHEHVFNYAAHLVQFPGRLPGAAIVLRGGVGVGKTSVYEYMARLFRPEHCILVPNRRGLVGQFNNHLNSKVLACADEAFFAGDRSVIGTLQSMITSKTLLVEPKGIDAYEVANCLRLIIASNSPQVVHANAKERRYFILEVSDARQQDLDYFNAITKQQDEEHGTAAMLYDLLRRNIAGYNPMEIPDTPWMNEHKELSLPTEAAWLRERLADPARWRERVGKVTFWEDYIEAMQALGAGGSYRLDQSGLTRYLQEVFGSRIHYRPHGNQPRQYAFPPLEVCRRKFDTHHDVRTHWEPKGAMRSERRSRFAPRAQDE